MTQQINIISINNPTTDATGTLTGGVLLDLNKVITDAIQSSLTCPTPTTTTDNVVQEW